MTKKLNIYWGDIHNHCSISYGHGRLEDALARAVQQLDFCSVTGHAFWHDIPVNDEPLKESVDTHIRGFKKLARNWEKVKKVISGYDRAGKFLTFPSYEWHSSRYGDHCVYFPGEEAPLLTAPDPESLSVEVGKKGGIIVPHHTAYKKGYRGLDWDHFDPDSSPLVEVFSMHGCSISDNSPYPYLHVMGPRDHRGTTEHGLERGYRFGFTASSDHHHAYPGSWGDGRMAVYASSLDRRSIWKSMLSRNTYAVTGDKIKVYFDLNGKIPGETAESGHKREIDVKIVAEDFLEKVELVKNNRVIKNLLDGHERRYGKKGIIKARIEWGWGFKERPTSWEGSIHITNGDIVSVEPCFRGRPVLAPQSEDRPDEPLPHSINSPGRKSCSWTSITSPNPTILHPGTQSLILSIDAGKSCSLDLNINGIRENIPLLSLLKGSISFYTKGYTSEAVLMHRAVPEDSYRFSCVYTDRSPEKEIDQYYLRVAQKNGQWAWVTPVWIGS